MKENIIQQKTFDFALKIIQFYLHSSKQKEFILSKQLLKSGTSIGANVEEALAAYSKRDFISKMSIAAKEARETSCWLRILDKTNLINYNYAILLKEIDDIINILYAIIKTSQKNYKGNISKFRI